MIEFLVIDDVTFNVPIVSIKRTADSLYKYAERTVDGILHSELIGVYFNYEVEMGRAPSATEYSDLWSKLTEPVESHKVSLPYESGMYEFQAYFADISDQLVKVYTDLSYWNQLSFSVIAIAPARV